MPMAHESAPLVEYFPCGFSLFSGLNRRIDPQTIFAQSAPVDDCLKQIIVLRHPDNFQTGKLKNCQDYHMRVHRLQGEPSCGHCKKETLPYNPPA